MQIRMSQAILRESSRIGVYFAYSITPPALSYRDLVGFFTKAPATSELVIIWGLAQIELRRDGQRVP